LERDWSPEQIAASLRRDFPADPEMWVSHETIYRSVYTTGRRELEAKVSRHLRTGRTIRQPRLVRSSHGRGRLRNMVSIHVRPAVVTERLEPGHWEGDLVMGRRPTAVVTLVERSTRYLRVVPLPDGIKADAVRAAIAHDMRRLPAPMRRSLTWDRGREMAQHQELAADAGIDVYFCDPRSPWQRGTNENTNRLLRQYLPKQADLTSWSLRDLEDVAARINTRPRRTLGWSSAHDLFWPLAFGAFEREHAASG
jgi:IS30 family transposase